MGKRRFRAPQVRRFLVCVVVTATVTGLLARAWGEQILGVVDGVPATASGWQLIGWLVGGPPVLLAAMAWNDRARFDADQRRVRAVVYGVWFGLGGFLVPARTGDAYGIFGNAAPTGNAMAFGWTCAAVANLAAVLFAAGIGAVRRQAAGEGAAPDNALATRFVESAWALLLFFGLLFALYGAHLGLT